MDKVMTWKTGRLGLYISAAVIAIAALLSALGIATFDQPTGIVDIKPFNIYTLVNPVTGTAATIVSTVVAILANIAKWRT